MKPQVLGTGTVQNITCKNNLLPEFPDLLFGEAPDGSQYFDATNYLQKSTEKLSLNEFFKLFDFQIKALVKSYKIPHDQIVIINTEGHQIVAGCLCYLFLSYAHQDLNAYLFERIDELFNIGITVSDSYLAQNMQHRFTPEICQSIFEDAAQNPT